METMKDRLTGGGTNPDAGQPVFDGKTDVLCKPVRTDGNVLVNLPA